MDQARNQRQRLDSALLQRKLRDTLTTLGEVVYDLAAAGELGALAELPEIEEQLIELEELERRIEDMGLESRPAGPLSQRAKWPPRSDRVRDHRADDRASDDPRDTRRPRAREADDGVRVWRPNLDDLATAEPADEAPSRDPDAPVRGRTRVMRERPRRAQHRGGGITFVDDALEQDEDLSEYMHDDDVAPSDGDE